MAKMGCMEDWHEQILVRAKAAEGQARAAEAWSAEDWALAEAACVEGHIRAMADALDTIQRLTRERDEARAAEAWAIEYYTDWREIANLRSAALIAAENERDEARAALAELEWVHKAPDGSDEPSCITCGGTRPHHAPSCSMHAALGPRLR